MRASLQAIGASLIFIAFACFADYPEKPIRVVSAFTPGGLGDTSIRLVTERLARSLGRPIIIDIRSGADGQIAALEVSRSAPDGYTLLVGETTSMSMVPAVRASPPYDPLTDFTPVSHVAAGEFFLAIHAGVPAQTLGQFIARARADPGALAFASSNASALLATAHFMRHAQIRMLHVPYRGEPAAIPDLLGGRVHVMIATPFLITEPVREGKLRVLAAALPQRSRRFPNVPTFSELGYPQPPLISWVGLFGPPKLPAQITARLAAELHVVLGQESMRDELEKRGAVPRSSSPGELREIVKTQLEFWQAAVRDGLIPRD